MTNIKVIISEKEMTILRGGGTVDAGGYGVQNGETIRISLEQTPFKEIRFGDPSPGGKNYVINEFGFSLEQTKNEAAE